MAEADNELVITLDADEYEEFESMTRRMDMTVDELAAWAIERCLDQYQARVVDPAPERH